MWFFCFYADLRYFVARHFLFGFLWWSSSWRWRSHIGGCKLCWTPLRAQMAVLDQFCKNVFFICMTGAQNKFGPQFWGFSTKKGAFFQLGVWCQNWGANVRIEVQRWNYNEIISFIYMKWSNVRIEVQMSELRWRDFTSAYRGSPPYTLSQNQGNRETGYSNVLGEGGIWPQQRFVADSGNSTPNVSPFPQNRSPKK